MTVKEIQAWIETLDPNNQIVVDEGGLTIVELTPDGTETGAYAEIGGIPIAEAQPK